MPVDSVLYNAKIFTDGIILEGGLAIDNGKIVKVAKETNLPPASIKIDIKNRLILPGVIDSHVHLRDQQLAYKEDFFTGTAAASAGGVTLAIDMPNNKPVTTSAVALKKRMEIAEKKALVNVAFFSAFPKRMEEISELVKTGAVGFKLYLANGIGGLDIDDDKLLHEAFQECAKNKVPVAVHAEDRLIIEKRKKNMKKVGRNDLWAYVYAHPPEAEVKSIRRIIELANKSGVHIHFCHVSSAMGLKTILLAKTKGMQVTCEVAPHHLFLSSEIYASSGTLALTDPPLRLSEDVKFLWNAIRKGSVDLIASDHAPHTIEEKNVYPIWDVKPGIPGLETTLPLLLTQVLENRLTFSDLVRLTSKNPSKTFCLKNRGSITTGNWADIVVVDTKCSYNIDASCFHSKAKYSPFNGYRVKGKVIKTFVNGELIMDHDEFFPRV